MASCFLLTAIRFGEREKIGGLVGLAFWLLGAVDCNTQAQERVQHLGELQGWRGGLGSVVVFSVGWTFSNRGIVDYNRYKPPLANTQRD